MFPAVYKHPGIVLFFILYCAKLVTIVVRYARKVTSAIIMSTISQSMHHTSALLRVHGIISLSDTRSYDCNCADNDKQPCIINKNIFIRALGKRLNKLVQPDKYKGQPHCWNIDQYRTQKQIFNRKPDCHFICHDSYEYDNCARQFMPVAARIISVSLDQVKNTVHYCHYRIYNTINECALLQPVIPYFPHLYQALFSITAKTFLTSMNLHRTRLSTARKWKFILYQINVSANKALSLI